LNAGDFMAGLPKKRQRAIKKRAAALIAEEATLRQVREARERSQEEVAKQLHIKQAAVSKLERRTDMYLSTLRGLIEAMGGKLEIVARFPNQALRITQFEMLDLSNGRTDEEQQPDRSIGQDSEVLAIPGGPYTTNWPCRGTLPGSRHPPS
jgi:transcriptional regulator with XRE-family HTH domain